MRKSLPSTRTGRLALLGLLVSLLQTVDISPAGAATIATVYSYTLDGTSATVQNDAAVNRGVPLNLLGDWRASSDGYGVFFDGDLVDEQSTSAAKPSSGDTLSVGANEGLAFGIRFRYHAPASGAACRDDTANLLQVGRAGDNLAQVKLQLSQCGSDATGTFVECRIAGDTSTVSDMTPVRDTLALEDGGDYIARCMKYPDDSHHGPAIVLQVVKVDPAVQNPTSSHVFPMSAIGPITSTQYLSVANKYEFAPQGSNTDQFVGDVKKVVFCQADGFVAAKTCLETEIVP